MECDMQFIIGILIVVLLFMIGSTTQATKKAVKLGTTFSLNIFKRIITFFKNDITIKRLDEFKETYKEIKVIKKSKTNLKNASSINILALVLLLVSIALVILNLNTISGNFISNKLYELLNWMPGINNATDMNTMYTAIVFSALSFSLGQLYNRWKNTSDLRKQKRFEKAKKISLDTMTTKQLYEELVNKDKKSLERYKENR